MAENRYFTYDYDNTQHTYSDEEQLMILANGKALETRGLKQAVVEVLRDYGPATLDVIVQRLTKYKGYQEGGVTAAQIHSQVFNHLWFTSMLISIDSSGGNKYTYSLNLANYQQCNKDYIVLTKGIRVITSVPGK